MSTRPVSSDQWEAASRILLELLKIQPVAGLATEDVAGILRMSALELYREESFGAARLLIRWASEIAGSEGVFDE